MENVEGEDIVFLIDEWSFFAEGGAHIVLQNINVDSSLYGFILRIPKSSSTFSLETQSDDLHFEKCNELFVDRVMREFFQSKHIHESRLVTLSSSFCQDIPLKISPLRPVGRKRGTPTLHLHSFGHLERNIFEMRAATMPSIHKMSWPSIAFEFKVKCGLISRSPFLSAPHHRLKLQMSRYKLMQCYKTAHKMETHSSAVAWGEFAGQSDYDPCDLCSRDEARIRKALLALFHNPQNNLRVLVNGMHVFGWEKSSDLCDLAEELPQHVSVDDLLEVLVHIVSAESLFASLQSMQAIDSLDSEGADAFYDRGIALCDGVEKFESKLLEALSEGERCGSCNEDCLTSFAAYDTESENMILSKATLAREWCQTASLSTVLSVLCRWMMAYIAQDASIAITTNWNPAVKCSIAPNIDPLKIVCQSERCGEVCRDNDELVEYEAKLLDIGVKPLRKIKLRAKKDNDICIAVANYLQQINSADNDETCH